MNLLRQLECAIVKGNVRRATSITEACLAEGRAPSLIVEQGILKAMETVGKKWKTYEYFIPNVLVSAMATKLCMDILSQSFKHTRRRRPFLAKVVAGTVQGDIHDIGKNIVVMFMEAAGFQVIDLGVDVPPETFIKTVKKEKANILLLSCLYTVTMHAMEDTIIALKKTRTEKKLKTLIGGAPITQDFADRIGADGFGANALEGVQKAKEWFDAGTK